MRSGVVRTDGPALLAGAVVLIGMVVAACAGAPSNGSAETSRGALTHNGQTAEPTGTAV